MKRDTHEFPLRIGLETAEGLRRYQIKYELETMEDAAKSCLREYLSGGGFIELDDPPFLRDFSNAGRAHPRS